MPLYVGCSALLGIIVLVLLLRFVIVQHVVRGATQPLSRVGEGGLVAICFILSFCGLIFLCKDALLWSWPPARSQFGPWHLLLGLLTGLNFFALIFPFVFDNIVARKFGRESIHAVTILLVFLWFSNVTVTYTLWGVFCNFCYFG